MRKFLFAIFCTVFFISAYAQIPLKGETNEFNTYLNLSQTDNTGWSQAKLAYMYMQGMGTPVNLHKAIYWNKKALSYAKNNNDLQSNILINLGATYVNLLDYKNAFDCYFRAAVMGNPDAQFKLSLMYNMGYGAIKNNKEAFAWISVAIAQGLNDKASQDDAIRLRDSYEFSLAAEQEVTHEPLVKEANNLANKYYNIYILKIPEGNNLQNKLFTKSMSFKEKLKTIYEMLRN